MINYQGNYNMFGLLDRDIKYINKALQQHSEIEKAIIFGSRAMGNYKKGSDVDIAIIGKDVNRSIIYQIDDCLNEVYPLPYFFFFFLYNEITNENLINHINNEGKVIYTKNKY